MMGRVCGIYWGRVRLYGVLMGKAVGKIPQETSSSFIWRNIIKTNLKRQDGEWTGLLWQRTGTNGVAVVNEAMNVRIL
jgi:hypothetical protein